MNPKETPVQLDAAQQDRLRKLLSTSALDSALKEEETARAQRRAAILQQRLTAAADAERAAIEMQPRVDKARAAATRAHSAYLQALAEAQQLEAEQSQQRHVADMQRQRCERELRELGGDAIERTLRAVRLAWVQGTGRLDWRYDGKGKETATLRDPTLPPFIVAMKERITELEVLRLSDMTPAAIEERCTRIRAEVEARQDLRSEPGERRTIAMRGGLGVA